MLLTKLDETTERLLDVMFIPLGIRLRIRKFVTYQKANYMVASTIFDEIVDFIASKRPEDVVAFRPSERSNQRYELLVYKEKTEGLTTEEKKELENFEVLEHLMRRAKAKAHLIGIRLTTDGRR